MSDEGKRPTAGRTTTLTILTDWPLSKPNRDLNGDQKAAVIGGVRRHVQSSANRKALWRRVLVPGSLRWSAEQDERFAGQFGLSVRTKHVARKLIAEPMLVMPEVTNALDRLGVSSDPEARRSRLIELGEAVFSVLQKRAKQDDAADEESKDVEQDTGILEAGVEDNATAGKGSDSAIAAYGPREMQVLRELLAQRLSQASSWGAVLGTGGKQGKKGKKKGEEDAAASEPSLTELLAYDDKLAALWGLSRLERLGIDGALFGTMVTKYDYRIAAPSAIQVGHSVTVHRAFDFETLEIARDDLEDGPGAAILLDASYASGLYLTSVTIDHAQLVENVMAPAITSAKGPWSKRINFRRWTEASPEEIDVAREVARAAVISILYATDHAMKTQTNARVMPSYILAETGEKGTLNHAGAFTRPIDHRSRSNSLLAEAIARLRKHSGAFDASYGLFSSRAELLIAPDCVTADAPTGWVAENVSGADAFADWVRDQVRPAGALQ